MEEVQLASTLDVIGIKNWAFEARGNLELVTANNHQSVSQNPSSCDLGSARNERFSSFSPRRVHFQHNSEEGATLSDYSPPIEIQAKRPRRILEINHRSVLCLAIEGKVNEAVQRGD